MGVPATVAQPVSVRIREYETKAGNTFQWIDRIHEPMEVFEKVHGIFKRWLEPVREVTL
jgi:hypothetical protein